MGWVCFDRYFDYLQGIKNELPEALAAFALDEERYALNGDKTLHDAWLLALNVSKSVDNANLETCVTLELLHAMHEKTIHICYSGVREIDFSLGTPEAKRPVDLLVHEFTKVDDKIFRHFIEFDLDMWIEICFSGFSFEERTYERSRGPE
jgi:hypothetical protein